jgi:hypothetical protein
MADDSEGRLREVEQHQAALAAAFAGAGPVMGTRPGRGTHRRDSLGELRTAGESVGVRQDASVK